MLRPGHPRNRCQLGTAIPDPGQNRTDFRAERGRGSTASPLRHSTTLKRADRWKTAVGISERPPSGQQGANTAADGQNRPAEAPGGRTTPSLTGRHRGFLWGGNGLRQRRAGPTTAPPVALSGPTEKTRVVRSQHPRNLRGMCRTSLTELSASHNRVSPSHAHPAPGPTQQVLSDSLGPTGHREGPPCSRWAPGRCTLNPAFPLSPLHCPMSPCFSQASSIPPDRDNPSNLCSGVPNHPSRACR